MIGFAGLTHLGIVSAVAAAAKGCDVIAFDPDPARCAALRRGELHFFEKGLDALLREVQPRIQFTGDATALAECEVIFISSDLPTDENDRCDFLDFNGLIQTAADNASPGISLVILSQVPPGTTRSWADWMADTYPARWLRLFCQVETLIVGDAVDRALRPERIIVGCEGPEDDFPAPYAAYLDRFGCPVLRMRLESAELCKVAINLLLVSSVSTANVLAELCEGIGADWSEIAPALRLDRRIGPHAYLTPGLGIAGGNLERDVATVQLLAAEHGTDARLLESWRLGSRHRRDWVLRKLHDTLMAQDRPVIALWGLAYKADTASTKNSAALHLLRSLSSCRVQVYDPRAILPAGEFVHCQFVASAEEACRGADALVILTPWREFAAMDVARVRDLLRGDLVIDPFGVLESDHCQDLGLSHVTLGKPANTKEGVS